MLNQINVKRIECALIVFSAPAFVPEKMDENVHLGIRAPADKWILKQLEKMEAAVVGERNKLITDH